MIESFGNQLTEDLFDDKVSRATRKFPSELRRAARRKLLYLHDAVELRDLRVPPGNRLETLKGDLVGFHVATGATNPSSTMPTTQNDRL